MLQQSFENNTASGVTGMMLYGNATFLQAAVLIYAIWIIVIPFVRS
jgi:hypothetical protein